MNNNLLFQESFLKIRLYTYYSLVACLDININYQVKNTQYIYLILRKMFIILSGQDKPLYEKKFPFKKSQITT
jgi:hypothetical protein